MKKIKTMENKKATWESREIHVTNPKNKDEIYFKYKVNIWDIDTDKIDNLGEINIKFKLKK